MSAPDFETIVIERPGEAIMRIVLNRPEARNAQNARLLYELNQAFDIGAQDDQTKVIILAANGPHFSAGHDLMEENVVENRKAFPAVGTWGGFDKPGAEWRFALEKEMYVGFSERWRNIAKPTIAEVQGKVISGGLMLVWPCDLIVAADDAAFQDNTIMMGVCGAEYFSHPWEVGVRKAKEMLFTADWIPAEEALRLGMVNHVAPRAELSTFTLELAEKIARMPLFALKLAKEAVNTAQDCQGRMTAMKAFFGLHQLCHAHNMNIHGVLGDPSFFERSAPAVRKTSFTVPR